MRKGVSRWMAPTGTILGTPNLADCSKSYEQKTEYILILSSMFSCSTTTIPSHIRITNGYISINPSIWFPNQLDQQPHPDLTFHHHLQSSALASSLTSPLTASLYVAFASFLLDLLSWHTKNSHVQYPEERRMISFHLFISILNEWFQLGLQK